MADILSRIKNKDSELVELVEVVEEESEEQILLPAVNELQTVDAQYRQIMFFYESGIEQITAKLQILNNEFKFCNDRI